MDNVRIVWVDVLRGFLILIVILGHAFQIGDYNNSTIWNMIYSFHMAAFFVLSGWIGYKPALQGRNKLLIRANSLLLPFVVWTVLKIVVTTSPSDYLKTFASCIMYPDNTYWFLYALFAVTLLIELYKYSSIKLSINGIWIIAIGEMVLFLSMALFELRYFGFQFIAYYSFFYALGFILRKYNLNLSISATVLCGLCWFVSSLYWRMHDVPLPLEPLTDFVPASILCYTYRLLVATLGALFYLNIARILFESRDVKVLSYLGKISLELYIIHLAFGEIVLHALDLSGIVRGSTLFCLSDFVLRTVLSVVIIAIITRIPMLNRILFSKRSHVQILDSK